MNPALFNIQARRLFLFGLIASLGSAPLPLSAADEGKATRIPSPREKLQIVRSAASVPDSPIALTRAAQDMSRTLIGLGQLGDHPAAADLGSLRQSFLDLLIKVVHTGPTERHQTAAAVSLIGYVAADRNASVAALYPLFPILDDPAADTFVKNTIVQNLRSSSASLMRHDAKAFLAGVVPAIITVRDPMIAKALESVIHGYIVREGAAGMAIDMIVATYENKPDAVNVNVAAPLLIRTGALPGFTKSSERERASITLGKMLADPRAQLALLKGPLNSGRSFFIQPTANTVDGVIGMLAPTLLTDRETINDQFYPQQFAAEMRIGARFFAKDPGALAKWQAFLEKVVAESPKKQYLMHAKAGLNMVRMMTR